MHEASVVVLFAGGGTGGHLYPALALADALRALRPDVRAVFVGAERGIEARILPERGLEHRLLPIRGIQRGRGVVHNVGVLPALARSLGRLRTEFRTLRPELVVVTGGYAGAPAGLLAAARRVPLALQEQNAVPGITTRLLAPFARQIHLAFPEAADRLPRRARGRVEPGGNPIRPPAPRDPAADRAVFGLDPRRPTVLVVGGSQGSRALNEAVVALIRERAAAPPPWQLLWSTGPSHADTVRAALAEAGDPAWVVAVPWLDDMPAALSAATVAVSRAGAMATSELLAWGVPALLVPLPTAAADHQARNAAALAEAGAAVHLPESQLGAATLGGRLDELLADPARLEAMARAARERGRPHAAADIARRLATLLPPPAGRAA